MIPDGPRPDLGDLCRGPLLDFIVTFCDENRVAGTRAGSADRCAQWADALADCAGAFGIDMGGSSIEVAGGGHAEQ